MLLGIYLGTSVASFATTLLYSSAISNKIKRDGYKFVKKSFSENLINWLKAIFKSFIPVYNVLNTIALFCSGDKIFDRIKVKLLVAGDIYKPKDNYNNIQREKKQIQNNTNVVRKEKKYEYMTTKEKLAYLEQEREKLLKETEENGPVFRKTFNRDNK